MDDNRTTGRRARRWFWSLVVIAVLALSALGAALGAEPGPATGLAVLGSSLVLLGAATQATRIQLALERPRRNARAASAGPEGRREPDRGTSTPDQSHPRRRNMA